MDAAMTSGRLQPPPGLMGVACANQARYTAFYSDFTQLACPPGSRASYVISCMVVSNMNDLARGALELPGGDWLLILGDDHRLPPMFLVRLLERMYREDLDVIVPLCLYRGFPFGPVLYKGRNADGTWEPIPLTELPDGGLMEVYAAGTGGMVIRRRVLEALGDPVFGDREGEDLLFCERAREHGFRIHADLDVTIGHITPVALSASRRNGAWGVEFDYEGHALWAAGADLG